MGVDPLTIGLGATLVGSGLKAIGGHKDRHNQQVARDQNIQGLQGLMRTGTDPYQTAISQLLGGMAQPGQIDPNTGSIDISSFLQNQNPGQDALMQFLRADPSKQTPFDASGAFDMLQANDQRQQQNAVNALNANFGSSIGQRFGTAARRQTSDLLANIAGQIGTRNAGIAQSSYENAANRSLQGAGLNLQAIQGLNQNSGLLAQLLMANQGNNLQNRQLGFNQQNAYFNQQLQGLGLGAQLGNQNDQYNLAIRQMIAGQPVVQGNGWSDLGGFLGQAGQAASFFPMLQGMQPAASGGATRIPMSLPQLQVPSIFNQGSFGAALGQGFAPHPNPLPGVFY